MTALAAICVLLALAISGCASLGAALSLSASLQHAGYQNVSVNIATGSGLPAGGLVRVSYSSGPTGNEQEDARRAELIVWDGFPSRFGALAIIKDSGGCAGPVCVSHSAVVASATFAQLAAKFGPRPRGLNAGGGGAALSIPGWAEAVAAAVVLALTAAAAAVVILLIRRLRQPSRL